jgi:hypothetical protein
MSVTATSSLQANQSKPNSIRGLFAAGLIFSLALLVRLVHFRQSLWCDEMSTLLDYVIAPWHIIVAARPGEYVPNNHVLYTILAKIALDIGAGGQLRDVRMDATLIRLPSLVAGSLLPLALAWPFRRRAPLLAILLAIFASLHPWLITFSDEARGYSLMILLGVVATNLLPDGTKRWPIAYGVVIAAALYTVSVAVLLLAAHGVAVAILRRAALRCWVRGALIAVGVSALLYLPMAGAILAYYRHPLIAPDDYVDYVNQLPRFALAGQYLPTPTDILAKRPDPFVGAIYWVVPVLLVAGGSVVAWSCAALRVNLVSMGAATAAGLLLPMVIGAAGQVRFVPWSALLVCIALTAIMLQVRSRWGTATMLSGVLAAAGWMSFCDVVIPPNQPVREAIGLADHLAPPGAKIVVAFLTAPESVTLYGSEAARHEVRAAPAIPSFLSIERAAMGATGSKPWVVISYEKIVYDVSHDFWRHFSENYCLVIRLPGRISPVGIYAPRVEFGDSPSSDDSSHP